MTKAPEIRFDGYTEDWEQCTLSLICDFEKGKGLSKEDIVDDGIYPCILYGQLFTEYGMFINKVCSKSNTFDNTYKLSEKGDILIPRCDTTPDGLGRASSLDLDGVILGFDINVLKIRNKQAYDSKFISVALNRHKKALLSKVVGSTVRHLENKELKDISIEYPRSIKEQQKIGNLFQQFENAITFHQKECEEIEKFKKYMLSKMFPQNGAKVPEIRFRNFTEDWEERKVGDMTNVLSASRVHKEEWKTEGVPFFRSSDVVAAFKGTENERAFISHALYEKLVKLSGRLERDDILITGGGSIGIPYIVPNNEPLYSKDADLIWIKHTTSFDSRFMYAYFTSQVFRNYISGISHVGTIAHYTIEQVKDTPITVPQIAEQEAIGSFFHYLDHYITLYQRELETYKKVKQYMLQNMFV